MATKKTNDDLFGALLGNDYMGIILRSGARVLYQRFVENFIPDTARLNLREYKRRKQILYGIGSGLSVVGRMTLGKGKNGGMLNPIFDSILEESMVQILQPEINNKVFMEISLENDSISAWKTICQQNTGKDINAILDADISNEDITEALKTINGLLGETEANINLTEAPLPKEDREYQYTSEEGNPFLDLLDKKEEPVNGMSEIKQKDFAIQTIKR